MTFLRRLTRAWEVSFLLSETGSVRRSPDRRSCDTHTSLVFARHILHPHFLARIRASRSRMFLWGFRGYGSWAMNDTGWSQKSRVSAIRPAMVVSFLERHPEPFGTGCLEEEGKEEEISSEATGSHPGAASQGSTRSWQPWHRTRARGCASCRPCSRGTRRSA